jgi:hypothetical protein
MAQQDMGNDDRGYAKFGNNRDGADKMDMRYETRE